MSEITDDSNAVFRLTFREFHVAKTDTAFVWIFAQKSFPQGRLSTGDCPGHTDDLSGFGRKTDAIIDEGSVWIGKTKI